ncbi:SMI1/KNR4 family protein [Caballeronia telluris]|uniref:Knr4/Smi1-like domain-containing protein n=1 Tax=Caballeronia telluris TaxID=326475 RepID=A0A158GAI5_9BURK|nr:SMI1/KNR4 family protein [Caballeronia telluris]SAL28897.1 hypothetical protein AWB66_01719 [Caballeronia telluris]
MIPSNVKMHLTKASGDVNRTDRRSAEKTLHGLGIALDSEFGNFYLEYQGSFISPRPVAELLDIEGPAIPAIPDQTQYVRERYQIPEQYLALTSDESEGMYLYSKDDQAVYDFDLAMREQFLEGKVPPRWATFYQFLTWYFEEAS